MRKLPAFQEERAKRLLHDLCEHKDIEPSLVQSLTEVLASYTGKGRRRGLYDEFDLVLSEYLRERQQGE